MLCFVRGISNFYLIEIAGFIKFISFHEYPIHILTSCAAYAKKISGILTHTILSKNYALQ